MAEAKADPKKATAPVLDYFKGKLALAKTEAMKLKTKAETKFAAITVKLAPTVAKVAKNPQYIKAVTVTVAATEKIIGKEKTVVMVQKIESCLPSVWMAGPKAPTKKTK